MGVAGQGGDLASGVWAGPEGWSRETDGECAGGYCLALGSAESDHLTFDGLLVDAGICLSSGDLAVAAEVLCTAVGLWRGPGYPDLVEVGLARAELIALEERRLAATEDLL